MIKEKNNSNLISEECKNLKDSELDTEALESVSGGESELEIGRSACFSCAFSRTLGNPRE